jgi:hypothetical protein
MNKESTSARASSDSAPITRQSRSTGRAPSPAAQKEAPIIEPLTPERTGNKETPKTDVVRHAAYLRWIAAGRPECDGVEFWLAAERELAPTARASKTTSS